MNKYSRLLSLLFLAVSASLVSSATDRPNILYFYVDDMGWGSIGPNGQAAREERGRPRVLTPNLDKLAAAGVNFTRSYGMTVCSPARSSQQTGFHQGHTFADRNDPDNAKKAIRTDDVTMGDVLSDAGYVTGYWGKWGYGGSKDQPNPTLDNIQTLPTSHGYQHVVAELHHVRAHTFFQPTLWTAPAAPGTVGGLELKPNSMAKYMNNSAYSNTPALQNHPDYPDTAYCDDVYTFSALDFVRDQAQNYNATGQPFFGLMAVQIPHGPFHEIIQLPDWDAAYRNDKKFKKLSDQSHHWAAMVTRIDGHFGNILAALDDPNGDGDTSDSVADNTLVIFTSDNGGPGAKVDSVRSELDTNGGLRGAKGSIYEGGIRIPTIMRWPSKINSSSKLKPGMSTDRILDVTDMLPTFSELAGVEAPVGIDGVSAASFLQGAGEQRTRDFLIHEAGKHASIIQGRYKLIRSDDSLELYDLVADRSESIDIASKHSGLVKELKALMLAESVTEPRGFANTYHQWTGKNGASLSDAANWSDYVYENAGITYMTDDGAPQVSWSALIENTSVASSQAQVDADVAFLGLEILGNTKAFSRQVVRVKAGATLLGRNEVRLSAGSTLELQNASVSSERWVDVSEGGLLKGSGEVVASLYNSGTVAPEKGGLKVASDYSETTDSVLKVVLSAKGASMLTVEGDARLAGNLRIAFGSGSTSYDSITILEADSISGSFANPGGRVRSNGGQRYEIGYTDTAVTLTPMR